MGLVLTRRKGDQIDIGKDVTVEVLEVKGKQARLLITAPKSIPIHRHEVTERIEEEAREAGEHRASIGVA